jgi:hypothetical protein
MHSKFIFQERYKVKQSKNAKKNLPSSSLEDERWTFFFNIMIYAFLLNKNNQNNAFKICLKNIKLQFIE